MNYFSPETIEIFTRLVVALALGLIIGTERMFAEKRAGTRTYGLVALGSALYVILSQVIAENYVSAAGYDPLRVASQIVVGLGFIGAGTIIFRSEKVVGLTTAAGIWVAGGIGIAAGYGLYTIATFATFLTLFTFTVLWFVESKLKGVFKKVKRDGNDDES